MNIIKNQTADTERVLYGRKSVTVRNCSFDGPADGESALKSVRTYFEGCVFDTKDAFF